MCRNLRTLFNYDPPATDEEIFQASQQFVRKISGFTRPSKANEKVFNQTINDVSKHIRNMISSLVTKAKPKNREIEIEKLRIINMKRFPQKDK